jgi:hypothetical protein
MNDYRIVIASLPDKEELVAEIYYKHEQWVEISNESGTPMIVFFKKRDGSDWEFEMDKALEALETAKKRFLGMGGKRN